MSLQTRKSKKSLSNSISQVSNDENIRDYSMFKNDVLLDIHNIKSNNMRNSKRSHTSSTKRKPTPKNNEIKENHLADKRNSCTYATFSKLMDEKNILIATQEKQIENLKAGLDKFRAQYENVKVEKQHKHTQDLSMLRQYERQNEIQIKQIEKLKSGIHELKNRLNQLEQDKSGLLKKNNKLHQENQQLTVRLTTLKEEISQNLAEMTNQKILTDLKDQLTILKEQARFTNELEKQNKILQNKCLTFENRINEYMVKFNQTQSQLNQTQFQYHESLKENDKLSRQRDGLSHQMRNLQQRIEGQRSQMFFQTQKLMSKLNKMEWNQTINLNSSCSSSDIRNLFSQLDEKFVKMENENQRVLMETSLTKMREKQENQQKIQQKDQYISQLKDKLKKMSHNAQNLISEQERQNNIIESLQEENERLKSDLDQNHKFLKDLEGKAEELIIENERINKQHVVTVSGLKIQYEKKSETALLEIAKFKSQNEGLRQEKEQLTIQILSAENKIKVSREEISELKATIEKLGVEKLETDKKISEKLGLVQRNIMEKRERYEKEMEKRDKSIKEKEQLVSKANGELKEIKQLICNYKNVIESMKTEAQELERELKNQLFMNEEQSNKFQEQITYYKQKYDQNFRQNLALSDKICQLQKQNTLQINENTQMMKKIAFLEEQIKTQTHVKVEHDKKTLDEFRQMYQCNTHLKKQIETVRNEKQSVVSELAKLKEHKYYLEEKLKTETRVNEESKSYLEGYQHKVREEYCQKEEELKKQHSIIIIAIKQEINKVKLKSTQIASHNESLLHEISTIKDQHTREISQYKTQINQLKKQNIFLQNGNNKMMNDTGKQKDQMFEQIRKLNQGLIAQKKNYNHLENKYQGEAEAWRIIKMELEAQIGKKNTKIEEIGMELKKFQIEFGRMSKSMMDQNNRKCRQSNREIENLKVELKVVKEENMHLQQIMEEELTKRKEIIQELIKEKKYLYEQLASKS